MQGDLRSKLTSETEVKSSARYFHELFACRPNQIASITPKIVQSCKVLEGEFGKNGSVIFWNFIHDGKASVAKEIIENYEAEKGTITYRVIEGDFLSSYKSFVIHLHVKPGVENKGLVKWTLEYEKLNEDVPDPTSFMDILVHISKQI